MDEYFNSLRRRLGLLTLLLACMVVAAWARGFANQDLLLIGSGQRAVTTGSVLVVLSSSAHDGLVWARKESPGMSWLAGWQIRPPKGEEYFSPLEIAEDVMKPDFRDYHWRFLGFDVGRYHHEEYDILGNYDIFSFWRISYASIALPLVTISIYLMFSKPKPQVRRTASQRPGVNRSKHDGCLILCLKSLERRQAISDSKS